MSNITDRFAAAFRDFSTDGVPASGLFKPVKADIRAIGTAVETAIATMGLGATLSVAKATRSALDADLAHAAGATALVFADPVNANNDLYVKVGASGTGSWTLTTALHDALAALAQPSLDLAAADATGAAASALAAATAAQFAVALARYVATRADGVTGYDVGKLFSSDETGILKVYKRTDTAPYYVEIGAVGYSDEQVRDVIGAALVAGTGITVTVNDAGDTITISATLRPADVLGTTMASRLYNPI